ncbi:MAG: DUF1573 domain-containing protein [Bacteroidetes bacterium]|jgi:hypothetical protein|nr:DUF1573 domain-containing protein [Bacteroidota bacterium]MBT3749612.1 DUF1573 domain-containing protein [Bacteroidota bacterium]MBT4401690.1 DUF1573 domain-containing protein [Bacteroidota bacterium]MBT4411432.1 DUF1573 domain-containing protein [Bacteroidota bacterium]MBT7464361.1 DUF1573 domain-containing protein [Bacteroidota bacterium]
MKRICLLISIALLSASISFAQKNAKKELAFEKESHDYGALEYEGDGTHSFKFKNTSNKPLVITNVKSSCNCTVPTWPKEPIQPGKSGSISVKYNTKIAGTFNKTIQVFSSAKNSPVRLIVKGKVKPHPQRAKVATDKPSNISNPKSLDKAITDKKTVQSLGSDGRSLSSDRQARKDAYLKKQKDLKKKKK